MFVKGMIIPRHKCFTADCNDSVENALQTLEEKEVDALPVLEGDTYAGIITRYGIYRLFFESGLGREEYLKNTKVKDAVVYEDKYLRGEEVFERTLLELKHIPLLPVVDEQKALLGIVTRYDVLEQFQSAFGMHKSGIRIAFTSVEVEGRISKLADIIQQYHESVISLVTFDETDKLVRRIVLKIEKKNNVEKFVKKLEGSGFRVLDIRES